MNSDAVGPECGIQEALQVDAAAPEPCPAPAGGHPEDLRVATVSKTKDSGATSTHTAAVSDTAMSAMDGTLHPPILEDASVDAQGGGVQTGSRRAGAVKMTGRHLSSNLSGPEDTINTNLSAGSQPAGRGVSKKLSANADGIEDLATGAEPPARSAEAIRLAARLAVVQNGGSFPILPGCPLQSPRQAIKKLLELKDTQRALKNHPIS